jgi:hypothetical protein
LQGIAAVATIVGLIIAIIALWVAFNPPAPKETVGNLPTVTAHFTTTPVPQTPTHTETMSVSASSTEIPLEANNSALALTINDPCTTTIQSPSGRPNASLLIVRPEPTLPETLTIRVGTEVIVKASRDFSGFIYQIFNRDGQLIGWVDEEYLSTISPDCIL